MAETLMTGPSFQLRPSARAREVVALRAHRVPSTPRLRVMEVMRDLLKKGLLIGIVAVGVRGGRRPVPHRTPMRRAPQPLTAAPAAPRALRQTRARRD